MLQVSCMKLVIKYVTLIFILQGTLNFSTAFIKRFGLYVYRPIANIKLSIFKKYRVNKITSNLLNYIL